MSQNKKHAMRVRDVADALGIGVSSVWRLTKQNPDFPKPFSCSPRVTVWDFGEVVAFIEAQKAKRPTKAAA